MGEDLDLNELCIRNPPATFFAQAEGDSMRGFGIHAGDKLVVDRSINAKSGRRMPKNNTDHSAFKISCAP